MQQDNLISTKQKVQQNQGLLVAQDFQIQIIQCDHCGVEIEPNSYCPNCFYEIDEIVINNYPQYLYPKDKIERESYYLFRNIDDVYRRQTSAYLEWVKFFYEKTARNKIRVCEYRKQLSKSKNRLLTSVVGNNICKCLKCKSQDIKWEKIDCPDNDIDCSIIHFGYRCLRCDNVFSE